MSKGGVSVLFQRQSRDEEGSVCLVDRHMTFSSHQRTRPMYIPAI